MTKIQPLAYTKKTDWLMFCYKRFGRKINDHIEVINQALDHHSEKEQSIISLLNDDAMWDELRLNSGFSESIEALAFFWKNHATFAGLSVKDLLFLNEEHIEPLETALMVFWQELNSSQSKWQSQRYEEKKLAVEQTFSQIQALKFKLQTVMLERCSVYQTFKQDRRCDDILLGITRSINNLALLATPIPEPESSQDALDDDTRLGVYDWLKACYPEQREAYGAIIEPIRQSGYQPPITNQQRAVELASINKFCASIKSQMGIKSGAQLKKDKSAPIFSRVSNYLRKKLDFFSDLKAIRILNFLWRNFLYILLATTLSLYFICLPALLTGVTLAYGSWAASIFKTVSFYGFALGPAWWIAAKQISNLGNFIKKVLRSKKREEIHGALEVLKHNQSHISSKLSPGILDIAHFDIALLEKGALRRITNINNALKALKHIRIWEYLILWGGFSASKQAVEKRLLSQKRTIKNRLEVMAEHISKRIGAAIPKLQLKASKSQFEAIISGEQIKALRAFVEKYGTQASVEQFYKNSNIITHLIKDLENGAMMIPTKYRERAGTPWGGHEILSSSLNGWHTLLSEMLPAGEKRDAVLSLIGLLSGKDAFNPKSVENCFRILGTDPEGARLKCLVQDYLFETLGERSPNVVSLMTSKQKQAIRKWCSQHQSDIKKAYKYFSKVFDASNSEFLEPVDDKTLAKYFIFLDSADLAHYAKGQMNESKTQNLAKKYFDNYIGDNSSAVRFLRFIPASQKAKYIKLAAKRRINWFLNNLAEQEDIPNIFDEADVELFKNLLILERSEPFNFSKEIRLHRLFTGPWQQDMEHFLRACKKNGFEDGLLLKQYVAKKKWQTYGCLNSYTMMKSKVSLKTCRQMAETLDSKIDKNRVLGFVPSVSF